jgi:hypothetical protein
VDLRGHITLLLSPVPVTGGQLLATLPINPADGSCFCGVDDQDVIATSTAFTFPGGLDTQEVCIVRLLVTKEPPADANRDGVINAADEAFVSGSGMFNSGTPCAPNCGTFDVNNDGFVNQTDVDTIFASAVYPTNVTCGAVYATQFSCGSYRSSPPDPAIAISLDQVRFASDAGVLSSSTKKRGVVDFDFAMDVLNERMARNDFGTAEELGEMEARLAALKKKELLERAEFSLGLGKESVEVDASSRRIVMSDVGVALMAVLVSSLVILFIARKK